MYSQINKETTDDYKSTVETVHLATTAIDIEETIHKHAHRTIRLK